jgi:hypothetical protein
MVCGAGGLEKWWTTEDLEQLAETLPGFNIVLILHGNEHRCDQYQWKGYDVIMAPSPQVDRSLLSPTLRAGRRDFWFFVSPRASWRWEITLPAAGTTPGRNL